MELLYAFVTQVFVNTALKGCSKTYALLVKLNPFAGWKQGPDFIWFSSEKTSVEIDILDPGGKVANFKNTTIILPFKSGHTKRVINLTSSGKISCASVSPIGGIESSNFDFGHHRYLIEMGQLSKKGTVLEQIFSAKLEDTFKETHEMWTHEVLCPTKELSMRISFPKGRGPKTGYLYIRKGPNYVVLDGASKICTIADICYLEASVINPPLHSVYKLEWLW